MRYSQQRDIIHQSITTVSSHPTAHDVFSMVQKQVSNISLGTIYRNLSQLVNHNLIQEIHINGVVHYDGNLKEHHHFYCTECRSIIDCKIPNRHLVDDIAELDKCSIQKYDIIFSGFCNDCKNSSNNKEIISC